MYKTAVSNNTSLLNNLFLSIHSTTPFTLSTTPPPPIFHSIQLSFFYILQHVTLCVGWQSKTGRAVNSLF